MKKIYSISEPKSNWGDYGHILMHGMTSHLNRKNGLLQLERTGPFIPPISFPGVGDIVVTSSFMDKLKQSNLSGLTFLPVLKKQIVELACHKWDLKIEEPEIYPESGEPEDYITERPHSEKISNELGNLFELCIEEKAEIDRERDFALIQDSIPNIDFFRARSVLHNYVSENAKEWLISNIGDYVTFKEINQIKRS